jgi:hypothetical protein
MFRFSAVMVIGASQAVQHARRTKLRARKILMIQSEAIAMHRVSALLFQQSTST